MDHKEPAPKRLEDTSQDAPRQSGLTPIAILIQRMVYWAREKLRLIADTSAFPLVGGDS